jgi:hypothetical protein
LNKYPTPIQRLNIIFHDGSGPGGRPKTSDSTKNFPREKLKIAFHPLRPNVLVLALPGIVLALVCLVPFLNKAYTIDDPLFLLEARQILKTPLQPISYGLCWMTNETCVAHAGDLGPGSAQALMGYLLVPVIMAGGAEWIAHLLQMALVCLIVFEMVRIALRLGFSNVQSAVAGLLLVAIPPFLSMASTAMPDILALALGLTGMERLLAWKYEQRWHQAVTAGVALGLAPYARPHFAMFLPLGALWLFDELDTREAVAQFRRQPRLWAPILIAIGILVAVNLLTRDWGPTFEARNLEIRPEKIPLNLSAYLVYLCFPIPFTAVWLAVYWRKMLMPIAFLAGAFLAISWILTSPWSLIRGWPIAAVLYGLVALVDTIDRRTGHVGTLLSLWVLIPLPAIAYFHFPLKFMLAASPAIALIIIQTLAKLPPFTVSVVYGALVLGYAGFSCLLLEADADFAEYGRRAAAELIAPHVAVGEKVWYGGEWGFYWYAQEAGATVSKPSERGPNPGDLLAVGLMEGGGATLNRFPHRELVDSRKYDSPHGRTMGFGAGLYSNSYGIVPWTWKPSAENVYELWRIQ